MVLFLSGYDRSEPGIGLGGLVPPPLPTQHHNPPLPSSELVLIFFSEHERFEPTVGLGGLAPSPLRPTSIIIAPPFFRVCYFFSRALEPPEPGTYGTFLARNRALPRPLHCPRRKMSASHPGYCFGWASSTSLLTRHHHPPPSTGDAQIMLLSC